MKNVFKVFAGLVITQVIVSIIFSEEQPEERFKNGKMKPTKFAIKKSNPYWEAFYDGVESIK